MQRACFSHDVAHIIWHSKMQLRYDIDRSYYVYIYFLKTRGNAGETATSPMIIEDDDTSASTAGSVTGVSQMN